MSGSVGDVRDGVREGVDEVGRRLDDLSAPALVGLYLAFIWVFFAAFAILVGGEGWTNLAAGFLGRVTILVAAYALVVLALNLQWGYTGLFNIGVAGFMAVGAYTTAILTAPVDPGPAGVPGFGLPLWVGIVGGMVTAAVVGALAALPALRLEADYLAIVTLALSEIIRLVVNWDGIEEITLFGAEFGTGAGTGIGFAAPNQPVKDFFDGAGSPIVDAAGDLGVTSANVDAIGYGLALLGLVAVSFWLLERLARSPFGRVLKAIREDDTVTRSLGKDTRLFKIKAFMIGCALMGLAGTLFRGQAGYISPDQFRPLITFYAFTALIIGGSGSNTGSVLGAATFTAFLFYLPARIGENLPISRDAPGNIVQAVAELGSLDPEPLLAYAAANVSQLRFVLIGVVLIYIVQRRPQGLLGHRVETAASVDVTRRGGESDE